MLSLSLAAPQVGHARCRCTAWAAEHLQKNSKNQKGANNHGGLRKGAGRPKGSKNRATIARIARQNEVLAAARAKSSFVTKLEVKRRVVHRRRHDPLSLEDCARISVKSLAKACASGTHISESLAWLTPACVCRKMKSRPPYCRHILYKCHTLACIFAMLI